MALNMNKLLNFLSNQKIGQFSVVKNENSTHLI
jgi:hypothetical protein